MDIDAGSSVVGSLATEGIADRIDYRGWDADEWFRPES